MSKTVTLALLVGSVSASGAQMATRDGLSASAFGTSLGQIALDGQGLPDVRIDVAPLDAGVQTEAAGFEVMGEWTAAEGYLQLAGEVGAEGEEDRAADLVVRVRGADLALSTMADDPLLLPERLLSRLPIVSLRVGGEDCLALALPPDALAIHEFRRGEGFIELRYRFGFTREARPELQMRAPFRCVLYRTDPRWHFRSALERYYRLFPGPFEPFTREAGAWFFAAETKNLPNPQHFHYHEGGPAGWQEDDERGMGTYPYQESSSWTISLPGGQLPKSYDEAMARFAELEQQMVARAWAPQAAFAIDGKVRHSGERSILADSGDTGMWTGAKQWITLSPPGSGPIVVRGWSRAEGISGERGNDYSIYVDVCYAAGGYLFGQCATFSPGTHDWEPGEHVIQPQEPVAELRVYCLLRNHTGKAWFDDLHIGPADEPDTNWVLNAGFEDAGTRTDLQEVRDHACVNPQGQYVVRITDNFSADVGPATPLNLLRFTLNVDPDLPSTPERPSVASRQLDYYDRVFRDYPSVDGCYIDSVSAWCYGVLNCRRDQWRANDAPFTYDPGTLQVAAAGRFAMTDLLGALQERYHALGKAIFTNIHVNLEAFPLYLVSDVPGIESSRFEDQDSTFFYRACSYHKPLLLMNFMNLHGLDKRDTAIRFHRNAAQWGELPSTGRFVQEAYKLYGDATHAWMPAIEELARAGWEPIPLATGAQVERFPAEEAVYFTVRAPEARARQTLRIEPEALAGLGEDLVAMDAVSLAELPLRRDGEASNLEFSHGQGEVAVVRIGPRQSCARWLLGRAGEHVANALRVQGKASETPELLAAQEAFAAATIETLPVCRERLSAALDTLPNDGTDLFALSQRREVQQALEAVNAAALKGP